MVLARPWIGGVFVLVLAVGGPGLAHAGGEVTLYRDSYGVPHVYADSEAGAFFGLGYAQAEDRLDDLYKNVRIALGTAAEYFGPDYVQTDYGLRLVRNAALCEEKWPSVPAELRALCEAFVLGVAAYEAEHPGARPPHAVDLQPWHCAAVGRAILLKWPMGQMFHELRNTQAGDSDGASNGWAVSPSRSAEGCPILLTDPHLGWEDLAVFYECRVFGGPIAMSGFCVVGTPVIALGHTADVGWACTTGGPDTTDVYRLKVRGGLMAQYEYDGEWRPFRLRAFKIPVKGEAEPRVMPALYSHLGPLISEPDFEAGSAYAGRTSYMEEMGILEQMYRMVTARDTAAFREALALNQFMEQNIVYAGRDGHIGYARVGRTPIRPDGYDWGRAVPGDTSATDWLGVHPFEDLVQIVDPSQGYLQNCNISPEFMMEDSPLTPDKYKPYIYHVDPGYTNNRGPRALELLAGDDSITRDEAKAIALDVHDLLADVWREALRQAHDGHAEAPSPPAARALELLLEWDGEFTRDSLGATLMKQLRMAARGKPGLNAIGQEGGLDETGRASLREALEAAAAHMMMAHGKVEMPWGALHYVGRGGSYYPCGGADFGRGVFSGETLFNVGHRNKPDGHGRHIADSGTMSAMLMFLHEGGIESYSVTPWGQSGHVDSPHYVDQARELYSERKLKPTWFDKTSLLQNLSSEKILKMP